MRLLIPLASFLLGAVAFATPAPPPPSFVLSHEGRLLDGNDAPVTGTKTITFALTPNAGPPSSGTETFTWSATYAVDFDPAGHYAVLLGNDSNQPGTTTPNPPLTAAALAPMATSPLYLAITIDQTPLMPRLELSPSPLSISALEANDAQALQGHPASDFALQADTYTKEEVDSLVDTKTTAAVSDLSTTVDAELALKADASNVYSKSDADNQFLAKTDAASTYLTQADAASTFLGKTDAASTYLTQAGAISTYATQASVASTYVTQSSAATVYLSKRDAATTYETQADASTAFATEDGKIDAKVSSVSAADRTLNQGGTATAPTFAVNTAAVQERVTGSCPAGESITAINGDGTVTCTPTTPQRVVRWMTFNTYDQAGGWYAGNAASLFGGVAPSNWTDNNYRAKDVADDVDTLRTLLTRKAYVAGPNAVINAESWNDPSSTNGRVTVALLRVKNSTASPVAWTLCFDYTAYSGWGETAGLALNGTEVWSSATGSASATACVPMTIPANLTSTVILSSPSSPPYTQSITAYYYGVHSMALYTRSNFLAFSNNSLSLPSGLALVDDLDYLPSGKLW